MPHQEFREQELLDMVTTLQYEGCLPAHIAMADRRNTLIASFQKWKGEIFVPSTVHHAIAWNKEDPYLEWNHADIEWAITKARTRKALDKEANSRLKRKAEETKHFATPAKKAARTEVQSTGRPNVMEMELEANHLGISVRATHLLGYTQTPTEKGDPK